MRPSAPWSPPLPPPCTLCCVCVFFALWSVRFYLANVSGAVWRSVCCCCYLILGKAVTAFFFFFCHNQHVDYSAAFFFFLFLFRVSVTHRTLTWARARFLTRLRAGSSACAYTRGLGTPTKCEHPHLAKVVPNCLVAILYDTRSESSGIFYYPHTSRGDTLIL